MRNLYCSACNKIFKNVNSFENHENSKKHKENVAKMPLEEDIEISDNEIDDDFEGPNDDVNDDVDDANDKVDGAGDDKIEEAKVNGTTEEDEQKGNSTSDIEDNDLRDTLSDDSDKVQVILILNYGITS